MIAMDFVVAPAGGDDLDPNLLVLVEEQRLFGDDDRSEAVFPTRVAVAGVVAEAEGEIVSAADAATRSPISPPQS